MMNMTNVDMVLKIETKPASPASLSFLLINFLPSAPNRESNPPIFNAETAGVGSYIIKMI